MIANHINTNLCFSKITSLGQMSIAETIRKTAQGGRDEMQKESKERFRQEAEKKYESNKSEPLLPTSLNEPTGDD